MQKAKELFNELFTFDVNEEVRHKGDTKGGLADMGLLVLSRQLIETTDDDGNKLYEKIYVCRMVRFSGSGDINRFREKELMTIDEYNRKAAEEENERNWRREEVRQIEREIFDAFGIDRQSEIYLMKDGQPDKSAVYKPSGFSRSKDEGTKLILRKVAGLEFGDEKAEITSKDEFVLKSAEGKKEA